MTPRRAWTGRVKARPASTAISVSTGERARGTPVFTRLFARETEIPDVAPGPEAL